MAVDVFQEPGGAIGEDAQCAERLAVKVDGRAAIGDA